LGHDIIPGSYPKVTGVRCRWPESAAASAPAIPPKSSERIRRIEAKALNKIEKILPQSSL